MTVEIGSALGPTFEGVPVSVVHRLILSMQISHYSTVLVATALMYDFITTIRYEIKYVWKRKTCLIKILFLVNRYLCVAYFGWNLSLHFVPSPSDKFCLINTFINYIVGMNVAVAGTGVLLLRTWALYNRDPRLPFVFITVYFLVVGPLAITLFKEYIRQPPVFAYTTALAEAVIPIHISGVNATTIDVILMGSISELGPLFTGCYISGYPKSFTALYLVSVISESILFILTVHKLWKLRRLSELAVVLFRDGTIYYVMIMASLVCATVLGRSQGLERSVVTSSFFIASKSIAISHLVIRLRGYLIPEPELNISELTMRDERTVIQFAAPVLTCSDGYGCNTRTTDVEEFKFGHASV